MVSQFPVVKIKLKKNGELSVWQYSATAYLAKSSYLKQHGKVVQPNQVAWLRICPGQNNDHLCPSKTMEELLITKPQIYF